MAINYGNNTTQSRPSKILQVTQSTYTGQLASSGRFVDPGILDCYITPQFSNSKILVEVTLTAATGGTTVGFALRRQGSNIFVGNQWGGSRARVTNIAGCQGSWMQTLQMTYLDSPGTTSNIYYDITMGSHDGRTWYVNRSSNDTDSDAWDNATACSTLTLMEIAA